MVHPHDNRVRPFVRVVAGILGALFVLSGVAMAALFVQQPGAALRGERVRWWFVVSVPLMVLGFYRFASYFLTAAWTGENPPWGDEGDEPAEEPPAIQPHVAADERR